MGHRLTDNQRLALQWLDDHAGEGMAELALRIRAPKHLESATADRVVRGLASRGLVAPDDNGDYQTTAAGRRALGAKP